MKALTWTVFVGWSPQALNPKPQTLNPKPWLLENLCYEGLKGSEYRVHGLQGFILGHFQVGSYCYRSLIEALKTPKTHHL